MDNDSGIVGEELNLTRQLGKLIGCVRLFARLLAHSCTFDLFDTRGRAVD